MFVNRERELSQLTAGLDDAIGAKGRFFLIVGGAGIGKTRVLEEFTERALRRDALVMWGRCWEGGGAPPYWPWVQVIRTFARHRDCGAVVAAIGSTAAYIGEIVPDLHEWLPPADKKTEEAALATEDRRFYLFDAVTLFLKKASAEIPLVIAFDDLHAADQPSLAMLDFFARELRDSRVMVVAAYREEEARKKVETARMLAELGRHANRMSLAGFDELEAARFIEKTFAVHPTGALVRALQRMTEGNPFFIEGVLRLLESEGKLTEAARLDLHRLKIPHDVREAIRARLRPLGSAAVNILRVAAVLGAEFDVEVLASTCDAAVDQVVDAVGEAVSVGALEPALTGARRFRFAHSMFRELFYADEEPSRRVVLHRRAAELLVGRHETDPDAHVEELAYHLMESLPGGDVDKAVELSIRAGRKCLARFAYEEAGLHFANALRSLEEKQQIDRDKQCEILLDCGEAELRSGELESARGTFNRAFELAKSIGSSEYMARASLGFSYSEEFRADDSRTRMLEDALAALEPEDGALRASVLARLAESLRGSSQVERRLAISSEAVDMARRVGDVPTLMCALHGRIFATRTPDSPAGEARTALELLEIAEGSRDPRWQLRARACRMVALLERGASFASEAELAACMRLAESLREPFFLWMTTYFRAMRALLTGAFADAERLAEQAATIGERLRFGDVDAVLKTQMMIIDCERGRNFNRSAVRSMNDRYAGPFWRAAETLMFLDEGDEASGRREFRSLAAHGFTDVPRDSLWIATLAILAEIATELGDTDSSATLYQLLEPYGDRTIIVGFGNACLGAVTRSLGRLAASLERFEEAEQHFQQALTVNLTIGARSALARTQADYARMLLSGGHRPDGAEAKAKALVETALSLAEELQMGALVTRLWTLRENNGHRPVSEPAPAPGGPATTVSEGNVFRAEAGLRIIRFEGKELRLRDSKGLQYLALLLPRPGEDFHVADLGGVAVAEGDDGPGVRTRLGHAGELLDRKAALDYRRRLSDLRSELQEAVEWADAGRATRLREEIDFLTRELSSAVGLGGKVRKGADGAERLRKAVTNRIRSAIATIAREHPPLGQHLTRAVRLGSFCSYAPAKTMAWDT